MVLETKMRKDKSFTAKNAPADIRAELPVGRLDGLGLGPDTARPPFVGRLGKCFISKIPRSDSDQV